MVPAATDQAAQVNPTATDQAAQVNPTATDQAAQVKPTAEDFGTQQDPEVVSKAVGDSVESREQACQCAPSGVSTQDLSTVIDIAKTHDELLDGICTFAEEQQKGNPQVFTPTIRWIISTALQAPHNPKDKQQLRLVLGLYEFVTCLTPEDFSDLHRRATDELRDLGSRLAPEPDGAKDLGCFPDSTQYSTQQSVLPNLHRVAEQHLHKVAEHDLHEVAEQDCRQDCRRDQEFVYIHCLIMIARVITQGFHAQVKEVVEGCKGVKATCEVKDATVKSFGRMVGKLKSDHKNNPFFPRPATNMDVARCLVEVESVQCILPLLKALEAKFKGFVRIKNKFLWSRDDLRKEYNLRLILLNVVYRPGGIFRDFVEEEEVVKDWEAYENEGQQIWEESLEDREANVAQAREWLRSTEMSDDPVGMACEIQIMTKETAEVRHEMHELYRLVRAPTQQTLVSDFARHALRSLVSPVDLTFAALYGKVKHVRKLLSPIGAVGERIKEKTKTFGDEGRERINDFTELVDKGLERIKEKTRTLGDKGWGRINDFTEVVDKGLERIKEKTRTLGDKGRERIDEGTELVDKGRGRMEDGTQLVDKGRRRMEDGTELVDKGQGRIDEGTELVDKGRGRMEDGTELVDKGRRRMDDGTELVDNGRRRIDEGTELVDKGRGRIDDGTELVDKGRGRIDEGMELVDKGRRRMDDGTELVDKGRRRIDEGTELVDKGRGRIDDGTELVDKGRGRIDEGTELVDKGRGRIDEGTELVDKGRGRIDEGTELVDKGRGRIQEKTRTFGTALCAAAADGSKRLVEMLVHKGFSVNERSSGLLTPLCAAAQGGHEEVVQFLLEHQADVNMAVGVAFTPLHAAALAGQAATVSTLLKAGARDSLNKGDRSGATPLHLASAEGHLEVVQLLLELGADRHVVDHQNRMPLHVATRTAVLQALLAKEVADKSVQHSHTPPVTDQECQSVSCPPAVEQATQHSPAVQDQSMQVCHRPEAASQGTQMQSLLEAMCPSMPTPEVADCSVQHSPDVSDRHAQHSPEMVSRGMQHIPEQPEVAVQHSPQQHTAEVQTPSCCLCCGVLWLCPGCTCGRDSPPPSPAEQYQVDPPRQCTDMY